MKHTYDVIIVGARIAGSVLAVKLGDAGLSVLIIDKDSFPSTTASTHFFRGMSALRIFDEIGILEELTEVAPKLTHQVDFVGCSEEYVVSEAQGVGELGFNINVRRYLLDDILNKRLLNTPNVTFLDHTTLLDFTETNDGVIVQLHRENEIMTIMARIIVGADGKRSTVARIVEPEYEYLDEGHRVIIYQYFKRLMTFDGGNPYAAEYSLFEDEVAYLFPTDSRGYLAAISLNNSHLEDIREISKFGIHELFRHHPSIKRRVALGEPNGKSIRVKQQLNYLRKPYGQNWVLIGDAGIHLDPWSGLGIDFATLQASFLAKSLIQTWSSQKQLHQSFPDFHDERNEVMAKLFYNTVINSKDMTKLYHKMTDKLQGSLQKITT